MKPKEDPETDDNAYLLPSSKIKAVLQPLSTDQTTNNTPVTGSSASPQDADLAANVIRGKIQALYVNEPDTKTEIAETEAVAGHTHSKHQNFMLELTKSGKSLADIQTAWHEYYASLPDNQKHEVWQEFYTAHAAPKPISRPQPPAPEQKMTLTSENMQPQIHIEPKAQRENRSVADIKRQLTERVRIRGQLKPKHHLKSLVFGLATGSVVVFILLFGFFNERFLAPFITPSRNVSATPIIIDPNGTAVGPESKVIIPKINVEIPVVYDIGTTDEKAIQASLENGVVHYASSPNPGQTGNSVIVGHSSNNILNKGKYKFAFVLLKRLEPGDTFYLTKGGTRYAYKVYEKKIVKPTEISVLGDAGKPATVTLITCDPPGTALNRLVIVGEQISPEPASNTASTATKLAEQPNVVPGNSPSLWQRFTHWITS